MGVTDYSNLAFLGKYAKKAKSIKKNRAMHSIINALGKVKGKKVLEIGCGSGILAFSLFKKGATVVATDYSAKWISHCKSKYPESKRLSFCKSDGSRLKAFRKESFDAVVSNMVLLDVGSAKKAEGIISEASRVLKKKGVFVFSDMHPLEKILPKKGIRWIKYSPNFSYFKNGSNYSCFLCTNGGKALEFKNKHWTLEAYTKWVEKAGLYLERIIEPVHYTESSRVQDNTPEFIVFVCKKL